MLALPYNLFDVPAMSDILAFTVTLCVVFCAVRETMLTVSDLPSFSKLRILDPLEGNGTGELALQKHLPDIRRLCQEGHEDIYVNAATGSGKSRLLPDVLAESCRSSCDGMQLLVSSLFYVGLFCL